MSTPVNQNKSREYASFTPLEIIRNKIETERLEVIPLGSIHIENALVDSTHASHLGESMKQKRGQISPITVRAREGEGEREGQVVYDIIDGFHRTTGKIGNGDSSINATVVYGCSDEEMYDLRVLAASSVKAVQFPRIVEWVTKSFETTHWPERGISLTHAFAVTINDSSRINNTSLNANEVQALKEWVRAKCKQWDRPIQSIYEILSIIDNADPELVRLVRTSGGGRDRTGKITPARLKAVVNTFPGPDHFVTQKVILQHAVDQRLSADETSELVAVIDEAHVIKPGMTPDQIQQAINSVYKDTPVAPHESQRRTKRTNGSTKYDTDTDSPSALHKKIKDLERALEASSKSSESSEHWWQTAGYLSPEERDCMISLFDEFNDLGQTAQKISTGHERVIMLVRSAFMKRHIQE